VREGRADGVALSSGDEFHAPIVASNADANVTFLQLLDRSVLPEPFVADVERISYASASVKINVALAELPNFSGLPGTEPKHLMSMFVQYAPYKLRDGSWDDARRDAFADRCFDVLDEYAPNFKSSVLDRQVLAPPDLERVFNLTGGNIFQGAMTPGQLFAFRPVPGYARYKTPVRGLYLCGSAAHPGGGVMGTPGLNAAREILGRRRFRSSA
jgi:phytoene dehydrogenase-like protein